MDLDEDELETLKAPPVYPDSDSESAYETNSEAGHSSPHDEQAAAAHSSRASSVKSRGRKRTYNAPVDSREDLHSEPGEEKSTASEDNQVFEDAEEWASKFQPPESPSEIKEPRRREAGTRKMKRALKPPNDVRAKRLKRYYNNDYRELLNVDIVDTATGRIQEDEFKLQPSQIGSSIWSSDEKDLFFTAMTRLGRDDVLGIAERIGSKSELQVQEYIQLLHQGINEKRLHENKLLDLTDMPAAIQVSDECSGVLERAGAALAIRQELAEEKTEQTKWGDSWLLTKEVSHWIEKRRREEGGEEAMDEVLPAANLFNLKHWLQLSDRVFMNPGAPYEEENWQHLAETGELPAIRATAFEDFHSLAVNITKRLVSATLFCTMSRKRARHSNKTKHAEITLGDVGGAVSILGMKADSNEFWTSCARRNHLQIFNDEPDLEDVPEAEDMTARLMAYDEVEALLKADIKPRSRSTSRAPTSRPSSRSSMHSGNSEFPLSDLELEISSSDSSVIDYPASAPETNEDSDSGLSSTSSTYFSARHLEAKARKRAARKAAEKAQDEYTEAFDMQASQLEEGRLWALLKQDPPFEMDEKIELETLEMNKGKGRARTGDMANWREWVDFRSPWEGMERPVSEQEFERNRRRLPLKAMKEREARSLMEEGVSGEMEDEPYLGDFTDGAFEVSTGSPDDRDLPESEIVENEQAEVDVESSAEEEAALDRKEGGELEYSSSDEVDIKMK